MQRTGAILVFDNDRNTLELLIDILSEEGYAVRTTLDSPPAATDRAAQSPALIILDLALPARTVATVQAYARHHPRFEIPVLFATTNPVLGAADSARGGGEYLLKPFTLDDLLVCVARYVQLPRSEALPLPGLKVQGRSVILGRLGILSVCG